MRVLELKPTIECERQTNLRVPVPRSRERERVAGGRVRVVREKTNRMICGFADFAELARRSINPNLADAAVEEMLIQHRTNLRFRDHQPEQSGKPSGQAG